MKRPRNSQYRKFWAAQHVLDAVSRDLKTERGVRTYVRNACERAYLKRRYPLRTDVRVTFDSSYEATRYSMSLPKPQWKEKYVARQLARVIWYRQQPYGTYEWAFHGPEYCGILLDVVRALMGKTAYDLLKNSFAANRVRFKPKKQVTVTEEMRERLAAARAKRESNDAEEA